MFSLPTMRRTTYILAIDLLLLIICGLGVYRLSEKAGFPVSTDDNGNAVIIKNISSTHSLVHSGDTILSINGQRITSSDEIEFLCNQYVIGDTVSVEIMDNGKERFVTSTLIRDYPASKIFIESFTSAIFFLIGIAVVLFQKKEKAARIFHFLCIAIATLILLTPGRNTIRPFELGYLLEIVFYISYTLVPILFLHFTLIFPYTKSPAVKKILLPVYFIGAVLAVWASINFFRASYPVIDLSYYESYNRSFTAILIFFALLFLAGFGNIIHSYRIAKEEFERRKLRWIFFGIIFGATPYIVFSILPRILIQRLLLPEEYLIVFSIIAPISFAIAIVRYRVFDINLLIKRSSVYTLVIGSLLGFYLGIVWFFTQFILTLDLPSALPNIIGAMFIALLFEPLRRWVQKFVDKKFFRVSYNFHEAQRSFLEEIKFVNTKIGLANLVTERIHSLLPVTKIGFFVVESPTDKLRLLAHHHFDILERRNVQLSKNDLKSGLELPVALDNKIEPGIEFESADANVFKRWGIALVLPMLSSDRNILGFLVLGEKLSGVRFSIEDISLLSSVSTQAGHALGRLKVEYALLLEQAESERLVELNKLKSYFVSSVSHDLKTPLTSIRLFAELIKEQENLPRRKAVEYLDIIEGEADRLSRLITNVLDFAKIEKGTKEYNLMIIDLTTIVQDVIHSLEYQVHSKGFIIHTYFTPTTFMIQGDADAIADAITNLITNAMKYSPADRKDITISTLYEDGQAIVKVQDEGYGIAHREIAHIFEAFYRIDDSVMKSAGGAGLGLSLVKHTMNAHHGRVEVQSEVGKGSIFALYFPVIPQ